MAAEPTELSSPCFVKDMKALSESPEAYIVYNDAHPTEYYLLENRQGTGNDEEIPSSGMLIIHVDYDYNAWETNAINNRSYHQRFTIIPADNQRTSATNFADTYPGTMRNTSLTDTSTPAAALYNANKDGRKFMGKPITEISESLQGLVSFTFMGGETVNTPSDLASQDITADAFRATWSAVEEAESYNVELRESSADASPEACQLVSEDLSGWGANLKSDGNTDISSKLDDMMSTEGWTGIKVFEGIGCAKLGSAKVQGELTSPSSPISSRTPSPCASSPSLTALTRHASRSILQPLMDRTSRHATSLPTALSPPLSSTTRTPLTVV